METWANSDCGAGLESGRTVPKSMGKGERQAAVGTGIEIEIGINVADSVPESIRTGRTSI